MPDNATCPATKATDWTNCPSCGGEVQRVMWVIIAISTILACLVTCVSFWMHTGSYRVPLVQKQILRIMFLPPFLSIFAFITFVWYQQPYSGLLQNLWEAVAVASFVLLLYRLVILAVTQHPYGDEAMFFKALGDRFREETEGERSDKEEALPEWGKGIPSPFPMSLWKELGPIKLHLWRTMFNPSERFIRLSLICALQVVLTRPLLDFIGIIAQKGGWLCPQIYSVHFAEIYLQGLDFISVTVATRGLRIFFNICEAELKDHKAKHKFMCIRALLLIICFQSFGISILEKVKVIQPTKYYDEVVAGNLIESVVVSAEMCLFSLYMLWAYKWDEYEKPMGDSAKADGLDDHLHENGQYVKHPRTTAIKDMLNMTDYLVELWEAVKFLTRYGHARHHSSPADVIRKHSKIYFEGKAKGRSVKYKREGAKRALEIKKGQAKENV